MGQRSVSTGREAPGADHDVVVVDHDASEELRVLLDATVEGIYRVDAAGSCTYANRSALQLLGFSASELLGKNAHDLFHHHKADGSPYPLAQCPTQVAIRTGVATVTEDEVLWRREGTPVTVRYASLPISDDRGVHGAVVTMTDVADRREIERRLTQANTALQVLESVAVAANEAGGLEEALQITLDETSRHLGWELGHAFVVTPDGAAIDSGIWSSSDITAFEEFCQETASLSFPPGRGFPGIALRTGRRHATTNLAQDPRFVRSRSAAIVGLRSILVIPIRFGSSIVAILEFLSRRSEMLDEHLLDAVEQAAAQIGQVVKRARAEHELHSAHEELSMRMQQLEARNREITLVNEMTDTLQSCLASSEVHDVIAYFSARLFSGTSGSLYLLNESRNILESSASWGEVPDADRLFSPEDCWALRRGRAHVVSSPGSPRCPHAARAAHSVCVPMMAQGEMLGVLHLRHDRTDSVDSYGDLAVTVAEHTSLALANFELREILRAQSIRDPLTGLFNRRYMEETLERELARSVRSGAPLGFVAVDVDHFKAFNDRFGHQVGDDLLRAFGAFLRSNVRDEDVACRYGGEEFALILPGATLEQTAERADTIRRETKLVETLVRGIARTITISAGVAAFPSCAGSAHELVRVADEALYRAKSKGRDRVERAECDEDGDGGGPEEVG